MNNPHDMAAIDAHFEWIEREFFMSRSIAQPDILARALRFFTASAVQVPEPARFQLIAQVIRHPRALDAIRHDPTLFKTFHPILEPIRNIGGILFDQQAYTDAVPIAERGHPISLTDRSGNQYELRLVGLIQQRVDGLGIFDGNDLKAMDVSWRRHVLNASTHLLRDLIHGHRSELELSSDEAAQFVQELDIATPVERLRLLDTLSLQAAFSYLASIRDELVNGKVFPEEIVPAEVGALARFAGLDDAASAASLDYNSAVARIQNRISSIDTFLRLSGAPIRIPTNLVEQCIAEAGSVERFVHALIRIPGTPVSRLHVIRVVVEYLGHRRGQRLARRLCAAAIASLSSRDAYSYIEWVRWISDELLRSPIGSAWPVEQRSFIAWVYGNQVMQLLNYAGNPIEAALETRQQIDCHDEMFYGALEGLRSAINPGNATAEKLIASGLADALGSQLPRPLADEALGALSYSFEPMPWHQGLYGEFQPDQSWLSRNSLDDLKLLLGPAFPEVTSATFSEPYYDELWGKLNGDPLQYAIASARIAGRVDPGSALVWARQQLETADTHEALAKDVPLGWALRLNVLTTLIVGHGSDDEVRALRDYADKIGAFVKNNDAVAEAQGLTLVKVAALIARREGTRDARIASFSSALLKTAELSHDIQVLAGSLARRLLKRLAAPSLNEHLSRTALLARFFQSDSP